QGLVSSEGVLPVGCSLPLHRLNLCQKQYASISVVNYPWSSFVKVHSPTSAHPSHEKIRTLEMKGVKVMTSLNADGTSPGLADAKGRELPSLFLHVAMQ
ncbi:unnamed protein product, partial [Choristocarpus tenellus]